MVTNMIKLKNGIKILFIKNNQKYINIDFAYQVGNKNENENQHGFAHLLEHLFLRSTKNKKYSTIINELEQYGSQINACTKQEFTHFFMDCLTNNFKNSFNLFLKLITNDFYDIEEYVKAVKIVNEEVELYRKSAIDILKDTLNKNIYSCGMKNSVTDRKFENAPNISNVIEFKNKHYCNNTLTVTISGKISHAIKKYIINKLTLMKSADCTIDTTFPQFKEISLLPSEVAKQGLYITNLAKCTQDDARPLPDKVFKEYRDLLLEEIKMVNPKKIILFGNQVSSIVLNKKVSVSEYRKISEDLVIENKIFKFYPVYYPVGNGFFNAPKAIEDLKYIIEN